MRKLTIKIEEGISDSDALFYVLQVCNGAKNKSRKWTKYASYHEFFQVGKKKVVISSSNRNETSPYNFNVYRVSK